MNRMLIVDDERDICEFVAEVAEELGFETRIATRPRDFIALYRTFEPDAVILDLSMPEMDGIEVIWLLADWHCRARLLLISGYDARLLNSARTLAVRQGLKAVNALGKPLDIDVLGAELAKLRTGIRPLPDLEDEAPDHADDEVAAGPVRYRR